MGCDIHFNVERRSPTGWERAETLTPNRWYGKYDDEPEHRRDNWYSGRNYSLFAMLADVRNGSGFAGVDIGDPVLPISAPRGLPDDVSAEVALSAVEWGSDGHSHSWFSLRDLLAVDWHGNTITHRGWVDAENFDRWRKTGAPTESCGGVSGQAIEHVSNEAMTRLIEDLDVRTPWNGRAYDEKHGTAGSAREQIAVMVGARTTSFYTNVSWTQPWVDAVGDFTKTLLRMSHLAVAESLPLDDVRAVFWFDN